jgi:hypothetical protein
MTPQEELIAENERLRAQVQSFRQQLIEACEAQIETLTGMQEMYRLTKEGHIYEADMPQKMFDMFARIHGKPDSLHLWSEAVRIPVIRYRDELLNKFDEIGAQLDASAKRKASVPTHSEGPPAAEGGDRQAGAPGDGEAGEVRPPGA